MVFQNARAVHGFARAAIELLVSPRDVQESLEGE